MRKTRIKTKLIKPVLSIEAIPKCTNHSEAKFFCMQCSQALCNSCLSLHKMKKHQIETIQQVTANMKNELFSISEKRNEKSLFKEISETKEILKKFEFELLRIIKGYYDYVKNSTLTETMKKKIKELEDAGKYEELLNLYTDLKSKLLKISENDIESMKKTTAKNMLASFAELTNKFNDIVKNIDNSSLSMILFK